MLIKLYTSGLATDLHIIEGVSSPVVHHGQFNYSNNGPRLEYPNILCEENTPQDDAQVKYISYSKDGRWQRLAVLNYAYICNDEGRTVEKVAVEKMPEYSGQETYEKSDLAPIKAHKLVYGFSGNP